MNHHDNFAVFMDLVKLALEGRERKQAVKAYFALLSIARSTGTAFANCENPVDGKTLATEAQAYVEYAFGEREDAPDFWKPYVA